MNKESRGIAPVRKTGGTRGWGRLRGAYARSEVLALLVLVLLATAVVVAAVLGSWISVTTLGVALLALTGAIALFAARRARLVAERVLAGVEAAGSSLAVRIMQRPVGLYTGVASPSTGPSPGSGIPVAASGGSIVDRVAADHLRTYLELGERMPDHRWLDNTILRNASVSGRDLLAWRASAGRLAYADLAGWLAMLRDHVGRTRAMNALRDLDIDWTLRLARVVALQSLQADDRLNALTLYRFVYTLHGPGVIKPSHTHGRVFQAVAYDAGEYELAREISLRVRCAGSDLPFMRADLLNPFTPSPFADFDAWLDAVNDNFVSTELEPITIDGDDAGPVPFDRVRCQPSSTVEEGPLVTVVVSAWQPDHGLRTAVESLLVQSWKNLEVLIVDDASGDTYQPVFDEVRALDPRVRVIHQPRNSGTYMARNTALLEAKGEFMTFLDSDDWNHPRRIEHQLLPLFDDPELMSTTSRALRTNIHLVFNFPGVLAQRENASSLLFRLAPVRERVGFFDAARKGADTEYALRIRRAFGVKAHRIVEENLSLIRLTQGSLSREEFKPGWRHPSRAAYRRNYEHWHRTAVASGTPLEMRGGDQGRPFPAPTRFLVERDGEEARRRTTFDIVFVADFRHGEEGIREAFDEIRACQKAGAKVAILHMESFRYMERVELQLFWQPIQDAIARQQLDELLLTDTATVGTVVIRDPTVLQFASRRPGALQVESVIVVADEPPRDTHHGLWYVPADCMCSAQQIFAARDTWIAQSHRVRIALGERLPRSVVWPESLPPAIDIKEWSAPTRRLRGRRPVIGRASPDHPGSFPARAATLLAAYPADDRYEVRMLGGRAQCDALLDYRPLPANWSFHNMEDIGLPAFLAACDFFVYFDRERRKPEMLRRIVEALASGCVAILPGKFAETFGDAAVYGQAEDVRELVDGFAADVARFDAQSQRARRFAAQAGDPTQFAHELGAIIESA